MNITSKKKSSSKEWLKIWRKQGRNLNSSNIENIINANGHNSALGKFSKKLENMAYFLTTSDNQFGNCHLFHGIAQPIIPIHGAKWDRVSVIVFTTWKYYQ